MKLTEPQESDENYCQSNGERSMLNSAGERTIGQYLSELQMLPFTSDAVLQPTDTLALTGKDTWLRRRWLISSLSAAAQN